MQKTLSLIAFVLGVVLIIVALLLPFVIVPSMAQLPDDVDVTRSFDGTMHMLLDAEAFAAGDLENLFITDVPVELERHVAVEDTDGDDALVVEEAIATLADGTVVADRTEVYSVDRRTMRHSDGFADDDRVKPREGLVIGWPIGAEATDEIGWSGDLQTSVPITFEREDTVDDVDVLVFTTAVEPTVIADPDLLAGLPPGIPKQTLIQLFVANPGELPFPANEALAIVAALPDPVPLTYLYSGSTTYAIEPDTGVVVDVDRRETREAALTIEGLEDPLPVAAVFDWSYSQTDDSVADAISEAQDNRSRLQLFGTTLPIVLGVIGLLLLIAGVVLRRSSAPAADATPPADTMPSDPVSPDPGPTDTA